MPTVGKWCENDQFEGSYDPAAAEALLTENGWAKDGSGFWAKDGAVPEIRWMINTGNKRREDTQALMIPDFAGQGLQRRRRQLVTPTRCSRSGFLLWTTTWPCTSAPPARTRRSTSIMHCDQIPSAENNNQGQNQTGWCNEEASRAHVAPRTPRSTRPQRIELIHQIGQFLVDDHVMLPLFQFPNIAAWRTDQLTGPVDEWAGNYRSAFKNLNKWEPVGRHRDPHRCRAVAGVPQPGHGVLQLLVGGWTAHVPLLPGGVGHHRRRVRPDGPRDRGADRRARPDPGSVEFDHR